MIENMKTENPHGSMQSYGLTLDKFLQHAAKWHPEVQVVTAADTGHFTSAGYSEVFEASRRISAGLTDLGVSVGQHVATLAWNTQDHLEVWYAIMGLGAVCHTLNPRLEPDQTSVMLAQSKASILFVSSDLVALAEKILDQSPQITNVFVIDDDQSNQAEPSQKHSMQTVDSLRSCKSDGLIWGDFDERAPSGLCFTSGTTGQPKGVTYTHRSSYLHTMRLLQADAMGLQKDDAILVAVPMFHANAWGLPFAAPAVGAKLVFPGRHMDGASLTQLIFNTGVTVAVGVPTVWLGVVQYLEEHGASVPELQRIIVGGAPISPALMNRLETGLGVVVQTSWGMTELSPSGTMAPPTTAVRDASLSGRPAIGVDLLLTDADGNTLTKQRNSEGHLWVRGLAVIERYYGHIESALNAEGWFKTGDLACIDNDGNLVITGRAKDLIKSGGEWINPAEIEAIIGTLPKVSLVAVIGCLDEKWGERPILILELRKGQTVSDDELLATLQGRVPNWWIPRIIVRRSDMPMASTGKIDKIMLRKEYSGGSTISQ